MSTARKLPSGNYRCLVFDYTDENGKRKYKSFTASTKKEAELLASQYLNDDSRNSIADLTVRECIDRFIKSKENTLSPTTLRGYYSLQKTAFKENRH